MLGTYQHNVTLMPSFKTIESVFKLSAKKLLLAWRKMCTRIICSSSKHPRKYHVSFEEGCQANCWIYRFIESKFDQIIPYQIRILTWLRTECWLSTLLHNTCTSGPTCPWLTVLKPLIYAYSPVSFLNYYSTICSDLKGLLYTRKSKTSLSDPIICTSSWLVQEQIGVARYTLYYFCKVGVTSV